jgi:hypothetical protein
LRRVTQVIVRPVDKIKTFYKLTLGKDGAADDFYVTGEHPFWVVDKAAWKTVDELSVGDTLTDFGGHLLRVSAKMALSEKQQTYNERSGIACRQPLSYAQALLDLPQHQNARVR